MRICPTENILKDMTGWILIQNLPGPVKMQVSLLNDYLEKPGTSILAIL